MKLAQESFSFYSGCLWAWLECLFLQNISDNWHFHTYIGNDSTGTQKDKTHKRERKMSSSIIIAAGVLFDWGPHPSYDPILPPLHTAYVYTVYLFTGKGGGEFNQRERERQQFTKLGRKYQHDWLYLHSINSDKKSLYRLIFLDDDILLWCLYSYLVHGVLVLVTISKWNIKQETQWIRFLLLVHRQIAQKHGLSLLPEEGLGEGGEGAGGGRGGEGRPGEGEGQQPEQGARERGTLAQRASKA